MQSRRKAWYVFTPRKKADGWLGASVRRLRGRTASIPAPVAAANPPQNCREYNAQVMIGGQPQPAYGWACQQPDGSWKISQETTGQPPQMYVVPAAPAYPPGYPYWAYDPYWGPRIAIGGTFVFGGGRGFHHHHDFDRDRGFHHWR